MNISVALDPSTMLLPSKDAVARIPLGCDIIVHAVIENAAAQALKIEDPATSQRVLVHVASGADSQETTFLLNPSLVDATGEMTAPPRKNLVLKPGETRELRVSLYAHVMDKCFAPGPMQIAVSYDSTRSAPCQVSIVFAKESVPRLLAILNDPKADMWVRKESYVWLRKVKPDFNYSFNENRVESFNYWWDKEKEKKDIDARLDTID